MFTVKTLRIGVEPVDVEVDEDDGILWTSLQTAFPGEPWRRVARGELEDKEGLSGRRQSVGSRNDL